MYCKYGAIQEVALLFSKKSSQDIVDWTKTMKEFAQFGYGRESLDLYSGMKSIGVIPDRVTFLTLISACSGLADLGKGIFIHEEIRSCGFTSDVVLGNALIDMYGKCGSLDFAKEAFNCMVIKDLVSWNTIIMVLAQCEKIIEALKMFDEMLFCGYTPDRVTYMNLLDGITCKTLLHHGSFIHSHIVASGLESEIKVVTALLSMYAKCRCLDDAWRLFHKVPNRDLVLHNAMIAGCACEGHDKEAIELYKYLDVDGLSPNARTFVSLLDACAISGSLVEGEWIHCHIKASGLESNVIVSTTLVNFYAKCGNLDFARKLFGRLTTKDVVSWNTMLTALAQHGEGKETLHLFEQMKKDGIPPNKITFYTVLSACCHSGMVSEGQDYFLSMRRDYGLYPIIEHYNILVDILVRAGRLHDAEDLIYTMPFRPSVTSWRTLLSGCRMYRNVELGKHAAKYACDLDPQSDSTYAILSGLLI